LLFGTASTFKRNNIHESWVLRKGSMGMALSHTGPCAKLGTNATSWVTLCYPPHCRSLYLGSLTAYVVWLRWSQPPADTLSFGSTFRGRISLAHEAGQTATLPAAVTPPKPWFLTPSSSEQLGTPLPSKQSWWKRRASGWGHAQMPGSRAGARPGPACPAGGYGPTGAAGRAMGHLREAGTGRRQGGCATGCPSLCMWAQLRTASQDVSSCALPGVFRLACGAGQSTSDKGLS